MTNFQLTIAFSLFVFTLVYRQDLETPGNSDIVVTDSTVLDAQQQNTIYQIEQK